MSEAGMNRLLATSQSRGISRSSDREGVASLGGVMELTSVVEMLEKLAATMQSARVTGVQTFADLGRAAQKWSNVSTRATSSVIDLLTRHSALETASVASHASAEAAKSRATASALKQTAAYRAIAAAAAGFQALGSFDFWAAAQDFTSAALWGTLAGAQVAAATGGTAAGGRGSRGSASGSYSELGAPVGNGTSELAGGAASAKYGPSGNLTVAIMGDNEAGEWLAKTLNTAVEQRGVQLTSTRSTRSAYAQG